MKFVVECNKFHGLEVLIEYYTVNPNILSEGLVLTEYVKGRPPPPDTRNKGPTNLLHRATSHGEYNVVSELLKTDYPRKAKNPDGQTAAHLASIAGKDVILKKLIQHETSVNLRDSFGYTPLHVSIQITILVVQRSATCSSFGSYSRLHCQQGPFVRKLSRRRQM